MTTWASNRSDVIMFVWSLTILVEPLVHMGCLALVMALYGKDESKLKVERILILLYAPLLLIAPTSYLLSGFDISICFPVEAPLSFYSYVIEIVFIIWIIDYVRSKHFSAQSTELKRQNLLFSLGTILFLTIFTAGNVIGSTTGNWNVGQGALFGLHIFISFFAYLIAKYRIFNIKMVGSQVLIAAFLILIFSLLFLDRLLVFQRILIFLTFIFCSVLGYFFIKGLKREVELKQELELRAAELLSSNNKLKFVNDLKSEFASLATHHILTPLTAIKGNISLIENQNKYVRDLDKLMSNLVNVVRDFLDVARIENEEIAYDFKMIEFRHLLENVVEIFEDKIRDRVKHFHVSISKGNYRMTADEDKLKQAIINIFENTLKYGNNGFLKITLKSKDGKIMLKISDDAVRNLAVLPKRLFEKLVLEGGKDEALIIGNGLGIYVAKKIIIAHGGGLSIKFKKESDGVDFFINLPSEQFVTLQGIEP